MNLRAAHLLTPLVPIALLCIAAATDWRSRRIPNWLTATVILTGFAQSFTPLRLCSPLEALAGFLVGFALTFLMYAVGGRGAGDVKLMAGIGAWLGPWQVTLVFCAAAIISMVIALAQSAAQGKLAALLHNTVLMLLNVLHVRQLGTEHVIDTGRRTRSIDKPMPNAVHVLIGTIAVLAWVLHSKRGG